MVMKQFVYAKKRIATPMGAINKNDVWILDEKYIDWHHIFFLSLRDSVLLSNDDFESFDVNETWDAYDRKICNVCQKLQPTDFFQKNQNWKNNRTVRRPSCNDCRKIIDWENMNPKEKNAWYRKRPNIEPFECPVCQKTTIAWITSKVVLDHDHNTGKIRGRICDSCNTWLWRFKDSIDLMKRAIDYLSRFE